MKLNQLIEAKATGALGLLMDAHQELGITHAWGLKHKLNNDMVQIAVSMMNDAVDLPSMGSLSSPAYPLNKVVDGFKKLGSSQLFNINSGLEQLKGLKDFLKPELTEKLRTAAATLGAHQYMMIEYCGGLRIIMLAIMEVYKKALNAEDEYSKAIATAVLKKLGLNIKLSATETAS